MQTITKGGKAAFLLWITKSLTSVSLKRYPSYCLCPSQSISPDRVSMSLSPTGMTKPLQQLRITQLMGRGAETLIVPDTNTAAPLLCIPICTSLPGRGQLSYGDARAALRAHRARIVARWLGLLTPPGCSHPAEGRPRCWGWARPAELLRGCAVPGRAGPGEAAPWEWCPRPLAAARGRHGREGSAGVLLGTPRCCPQPPNAALLLRNALNLYSIVVLPPSPREITSAIVKNEDYSYCCQSLAFSAPEVLKTWKR